jgi:hypothetical protein
MAHTSCERRLKPDELQLKREEQVYLWHSKHQQGIVDMRGGAQETGRELKGQQASDNRQRAAIGEQTLASCRCGVEARALHADEPGVVPRLIESG